MPTIVEQIQRDALDHSVPASALLRRVKLAAAKLGLEGVEGWVDSELQGYEENSPDYRIVVGTPKARHPYHGWRHVTGQVEQVSRRRLDQSVASLEDILQRDNNGSRLIMPFPDELTELLNEENGTPWATYALFIDRSQLVGILDRVRTLVLEWAIQLERAGILGTEFSFHQEEKAKAQEPAVNITIGKIGQFTGNLGIGNTSGAITASDINLTQVQDFVDQVRRHADDLVRAGVPKGNFEQSLIAIQEEVAKQAPDTGKVRSLVTDVRNAVSGAAGNLIASGVVTMADKLLGG